MPTEYVRHAPGTDIPVRYGLMWHISINGWEDKAFIKQRVYGFDALPRSGEVNPVEVDRFSGVPGDSLTRVARCFPRRAVNADLGYGPYPENRRHGHVRASLHRTIETRQCRRPRTALTSSAVMTRARSAP